MIPTKTIQLDFWRHPTDILHLVQGEADGRKVTFKITDNGAAFNLTGYTVQFAVNKPDGNIVVNSATVTDAAGGIVDVVISSQVVAVAGNLHAELQIIKTGQLSKSFRIVTKVAPGVDIDGIDPSVTEFGVLQTLIGQAEAVISGTDVPKWRPWAKNTNANTLGTGIYVIIQDTDATEYNYPYQWGILVSFTSAAYVFQIFAKHVATEIFVRTGQSASNWNAWKSLTVV